MQHIEKYKQDNGKIFISAAHSQFQSNSILQNQPKNIVVANKPEKPIRKMRLLEEKDSDGEEEGVSSSSSSYVESKKSLRIEDIDSPHWVMI